MKLGHVLLRTVMLALFVMGLSGCTDSLLAPPPGDGPGGTAPTGPELLLVEPDGSTQWTRSPVAEDPSPLPLTPRSIQVCADVDGSVGARLQCGRFVLAVPPGAFDGTAKICMSMSDSTVMVVDLDIDPLTLNDFKEPVMLCLITEDADVDEKDVTIYWYDPALDGWTAMVCDRDLSNYPQVTGGSYTKGVLTSLDHFSRYSGGKAGW